MAPETQLDGATRRGLEEARRQYQRGGGGPRGYSRNYTPTQKVREMLHGNLSNMVVPRLVLVFEGALGFLPASRVADFNNLGSAGAWDQAALCWDLNNLMMRKIWDVVHRQSFRIEVATYCGPPELAQSLQERFDSESLPITRTFASTPERMARRLAYAPDIAVVYDADQAHAWTYGGKGRLLRSVHELGRL